MNPILERSPAALYARSVFFEHSNDVDVYVEDTDEGAVKLYTILIQRALGDALHIDQVYPLGGFQRVLERCQSDQGLWGRLRIYLVDGDLRLIHRNGLVVLRRLVYLPRYSIENFLIDEEAAIELLYQEDPTNSRDALRGALVFSKWLTQVCNQLVRLFARYAVAHAWQSEVQTVGFKIKYLVQNESGEIDHVKVRQRSRQVEEYLNRMREKKEVRLQIANNLRFMRRCGCSPVKKFVSGKDYLLPLMLIRLNNITKLRSHQRVIKNRLAMMVDIAELKHLLLDAVREQNELSIGANEDI